MASTAGPTAPHPGSRGEVMARIALVVAASAIAAAWVAHTVAAPGAFAAAPPAEYRITVRPARPHDGSFWINRLLIDGRLQSVGALADARLWQPEPFDPTVEPLFRLEPGLESAAIDFRARRFVLVTHSTDFAGTVTVQRDRVPIRQLAIAPTDTVAFIDPFPPTATGWRLALGLLLTGLLALTWRPWRGAVRATGWLATVLGAVHLCFWLTMAIGTTNDSPEYLISLEALRHGVPSYFPPGYPALLGVARLLGGSAFPLLLTFVQHVLVVVAALWLFLILRRMVGESLALAAALFAGGIAAGLAIPQELMSEAATLFATVGTIWFAIRVREGGRRRDAVVGGLLLGAAGLLRVVPALALAPACGILLLLPWRDRKPRRLALMVTTACLLMAAPVLWFGIRSGRPALADSSALHLFNRVVAQQRLLDPSAAGTRTLLASLGGADPRGLSWWDAWSKLQSPDMPDSTFQALLGRVAWEGIRSDPVGFVGYVPALAWEELMSEPSTWTPRWGESKERQPTLEVPAPGPVTASGLAWRERTAAFARQAWPAIGWLALLGMAIAAWHPERLVVLALASVPAFYLLGTATLEAFDVRYNFPVSTCLIALGAVFLDGARRVPKAVRAGIHRRVWRSLVDGGRVVLERAGRLAPHPRDERTDGDAARTPRKAIA